MSMDIIIQSVAYLKATIYMSIAQWFPVLNKMMTLTLLDKFNHNSLNFGPISIKLIFLESGDQARSIGTHFRYIKKKFWNPTFLPFESSIIQLTWTEFRKSSIAQNFI